MNPIPTTVTPSTNWLSMPSHFPPQQEVLDYCRAMSPGLAAGLILAGVIFLIWGFMLYRGLVIFNAALLGGWIGGTLGQSNGSALAGAALGAFTFGAIAWPLMKYAVALMGGMYGALLGASLWRTFGLEPHLAWAGGAMGLVALGMLSFVLFRTSVILYTSLQGSAMLVFGLLGLIFKYQEIQPQLSQNLLLRPMLMPTLIFIPTLLGLIYQQSSHTAGPPAKK